MCPKHVYPGTHRRKCYFTIICFFLALLPDKPTTLTVTNIKSRTARISWLDPNNTGVGNLTGFWIQLKKENSLIQNITKDKNNECDLDNLTPYTTYKISVAVRHKHGFGEETVTSFLTLEEGIRMRFFQCFKYGRFCSFRELKYWLH
jgi:hypothetical protein